MKEKTFLLCIPFRHLNLRPTDAARIFPFFNLREEGNSTTVCKLTSRLRYEQQNGGKYFNTNNMIILLLRVRAEAGHNGSTLFGPTFQPTNRPTDQLTNRPKSDRKRPWSLASVKVFNDAIGQNPLVQLLFFYIFTMLSPF